MRLIFFGESVKTFGRVIEPCAAKVLHQGSIGRASTRHGCCPASALRYLVLRIGEAIETGDDILDRREFFGRVAASASEPNRNALP